MSATLTRACNGCIKAKRKCSRDLPHCRRCRQRSIFCEYKNFPLAHKNRPAISGTFNMQDSSHYGNQAKPSPKHSSIVVSTALRLSLDHLLLEVPDIVMKMDQPSVAYLLEYLRTLPNTFVQTGGTIFMHPRLHPNGLPPSLAMMFSLCAIHSHANPQNQHIVSEAISSTTMKLLRLGSSLPTFVSKLEFVQSLILLQIITLFDARAPLHLKQLAENRQVLLESAELDLFNSVPAYLPSLMDPYQAWILAESCRRTIHAAHMVLGLYSMISQGNFVLTLFVEALPIHRDTMLWETEERFETQQGQEQKAIMATRENNLMSYRELTNLWDTGGIKKLGPFEKLLVVACKGIQAVEGLGGVAEECLNCSTEAKACLYTGTQPLGIPSNSTSRP